MDSRFLFALGLLLIVGIVKADEYNEEKVKETKEDESKVNEDEQTLVNENMESETTALAQNDPYDPDYIKNKGLCHSGIGIWHKPGVSIRCSCLRCTCRKGGNWACAYNFAYCPYYYCGNQIYNPATQVCCCGKVHSKRRFSACCGYFYYDTRRSQCCRYYSVKPKKARCPRYTV